MPRILSLSFDAATSRNGWGWFDPAAVREQITVYDQIDQFKSGTPKLADCVTTKILDATAADRPKLA